MILPGMFSEIIAHNMHQKIRQLYTNITVFELYLVLPEFIKHICLPVISPYLWAIGQRDLIKELFYSLYLGKKSVYFYQ